MYWAFAKEIVAIFAVLLWHVQDYLAVDPQWPLLLAWFNFNPSMDK